MIEMITDTVFQTVKTVISTDDPEIVEYRLQLSKDFVICLPLKQDGYINVTSLAKATGKRLDSWFRKPYVKKLIDNFKVLPQFEEVPPFYTRVGQSSKYGSGTFMHPVIAEHFAIHCYPDYALQVGMWMNELRTTGNVTIGHEKTETELNECRQKLIESAERVEKIKEEKKQVEKKHEAILYKRNRPSLKRGPCFYILYETQNTKNVKVGFSSNFQKRFYDHLSCNDVNLAFIAYLEDNTALEKLVKIKFRSKMRPHTTEWLQDVEYLEVVEYTEKVLKDMDVVYTTYKSLEEIYIDVEDFYNEIELEKKEKQCSKCKETKEFSLFPKDRMKKDGYHSQCKACDKKRKEDYRKKTRPILSEKLCVSCKILKPIDEYTKHLSNKDGYCANCKPCMALLSVEKRKGEKDAGILYVCKTCTKSFTRKDALVVHINTYCK